MSRAFILSLDAVLTVFIVMAVILASSFFLDRSALTDWDSAFLQATASDFLVVADRQGILSSFMSDSDAAKQLYRILPKRACARLNVYDSSGALFLSSVRSGCSKFAPVTGVSRRAFIYSGSIYLAEVVMWYK